MTKAKTQNVKNVKKNKSYSTGKLIISRNDASFMYFDLDADEFLRLATGAQLAANDLIQCPANKKVKSRITLRLKKGTKKVAWCVTPI